jgi:hypothetical protein
LFDLTTDELKASFLVHLVGFGRAAFWDSTGVKELRDLEIVFRVQGIEF